MSWEPYEGGYERTRNPELIKILLEEIQKEALWVQFLASDFRSGPTVLLEVRARELIFDLPRPWDPHLQRARIVYRDKSQIIHYFQVDILRTHTRQRIVVTSKPREVYRLERRRFYRVEVPEPSKAIFQWGDREIAARVLNISGCGMAIILNANETLPVGEELSDIHLELYLSVSKAFKPIVLPRARIVREQIQEQQKLYGIDFLISDREREPLLRYVLKREIELCRAKSSRAV